jgi:hypothetical protein
MLEIMVNPHTNCLSLFVCNAVYCFPLQVKNKQHEGALNVQLFLGLLAGQRTSQIVHTSLGFYCNTVYSYCRWALPKSFNIQIPLIAN